jgi:hypothetical protein
MYLLVSTHSTLIAVVKIDSSCAVSRIHATHFWETALSTLVGFIECGNRSDLQMGASTLHQNSIHSFLSTVDAEANIGQDGEQREKY